MKLKLNIQCTNCGIHHEVTVESGDYQDWRNGKLAQMAFPYLSADDRELLISHICSKCWDEFFN